MIVERICWEILIFESVCLRLFRESSIESTNWIGKSVREGGFWLAQGEARGLSL